MSKKVVAFMVISLFIVLGFGGTDNLCAQWLYASVHVPGYSGTDSESFTSSSPYTYYWAHYGEYKINYSGNASGLSRLTVSNGALYNQLDLEDMDDETGDFSYSASGNVTLQPNTNYTITLYVYTYHGNMKYGYFHDNHGTISNH